MKSIQRSRQRTEWVLRNHKSPMELGSF